MAKKETTTDPKTPARISKNPDAGDGNALAKEGQSTIGKPLRILEIPVADERKYFKLNLYELARLVASFLFPYRFVRAAYLFPGVQQNRPYNLLFEIPEVPDDMAELHSQFTTELWNPPEKCLSFERIYRDGQNSASIDEWMWYDVKDVRNIQGAGEPVCLCAREDVRKEKVPVPDSGPSLPTEQPLGGYKEIGKFLGVKPETVEKSYKPDGAPIRRDEKSRRVWAFPSELKAWKESRSTKNRRKERK